MDKDKLFQVALAYYRQQDLSKMTPEEALKKFESIHAAMSEAQKSGNQQRITY